MAGARKQQGDVGYYGLNMGDGASLTEDANFVEADAPAPPGIADYGTPQGSGYNSYPGAGANAGGGRDLSVENASAAPTDNGSGVVKAAAAGSAAGPWGAAIMAGAAMLQQISAQKEAAKARKIAQQLQQKQMGQEQVAAGQQGLVRAAGNYGSREQSALARLAQLLQNSRRG